jgi:hypothetical protein
MSDLKAAIRGAANRHEPPEDWLDRIHERARKKRRNQRVLAGVVGLGLSFGLTIALVSDLRTSGPARPGARGTTAPTRCGSGTSVPPTGWWRADDSAADAAGGHSAVLRGGATYDSGIVGHAFALNGESAYAEVPDDPSLNVGSNDFTVAFWVKFASIQGEQVLIQDWVETFDPATSKGWTLLKLKGSGIGFALGAAGLVTASGLDLPVDTWIHIAARRKDGSVSIFVDGTLVRTRPLNDTRLSLDSPASLKFGHEGSPEDTPGSLDSRGFFLNGDLDEIELFVGRALSDAQIQQIFLTQSSCVGSG